MKSLSALLKDEGLRSVILLLIGFVIGQFNSYFTTRKERKEAVSTALHDLLEVRHQYFALEVVMQELEKISAFPQHLQSQLRLVFDTFLPNWEELHHRYEESVTVLAGLDPLLAFNLRSKDLVRPMMLRIHSLMAADPQAAALVAPLLKSSFTPSIEKAFKASILRLARNKSWVCWYYTKKVLKRKDDFPKEFLEIIGPFKAVLETHLKAAVSSGQPVPVAHLTQPNANPPKPTAPAAAPSAAAQKPVAPPTPPQSSKKV